VRSEDIALDVGPSPQTTAARVALVEPLGSDTFLELEAGDASLTARVDADRRPAIGESVNLRFRLENLHLFDATSGARLND
jgi:ABC-type sugar transport system ATPase subunit